MLRLHLTRTTDGTALCFHTVKTLQEADKHAEAYAAMQNITVTVEILS